VTPSLTATGVRTSRQLRMGVSAAGVHNRDLNKPLGRTTIDATPNERPPELRFSALSTRPRTLPTASAHLSLLHLCSFFSRGLRIASRRRAPLIVPISHSLSSVSQDEGRKREPKAAVGESPSSRSPFQTRRPGRALLARHLQAPKPNASREVSPTLQVCGKRVLQVRGAGLSYD
jgi:hypothetical protein